MKARKRYLLLLIFFFALIYFRFNRFHENYNKTRFESDFNKNIPKLKPKSRAQRVDCRLNTCFDFTRCRNVSTQGLRVHVYGQSQRISESFAKILEIIKSSVYYESDPNKACIFLSGVWDPLDRDPLSRDFQKPNPLMSRVDPLFNGQNHVIFNLYSGSFPDYRELDFAFNQNYGTINEILKKAILVKASQSRESYRKDFDISFPLFSRNHPKRGPPFVSHESQQIPMAREDPNREMVRNGEKRRHLLVFKGKRYIYGIGSETRNALHHLNNGRDVLMVTTCRHGKKWKDWKDDKCDEDNTEYDKHDYQQLMANSTFCLVPRGRRLASYRFLESLQMGCLPVVLSNSWVLPFEDIIQWEECVVFADERLLLQIPETLRTFSEQKIQRMRHKCLLLFETYFSSVERIVFTSLHIIESRVERHLSSQAFSSSLSSSPSLVTRIHLNLLKVSEDHVSDPRVTAVIFAQKASDVTDAEKLKARLKHVFDAIHVVSGEEKSKFSVAIETEAVMQLSSKTQLTSEEISFAINVWNSFPNRLIGFQTRDHFWNEDHFQMTSKWTNSYSLLSLDGCLHHVVYAQAFSLFTESNQFFNQSIEDNCLDIAFGFFVAHITREGPLKVTQRKKTFSQQNSFSEWTEQKTCFRRLQQLFSYLPLISSHIRMDPLLFKDMVSVLRKKYRKMETIS